jgi:hypothetical protein
MQPLQVCYKLLQVKHSGYFAIKSSAVWRTFSKINREKHDRIFNELVCAYVVLTMLILEGPDLRVDSNMKSCI